MNTWRIIYNENRQKSFLDIKNVYVNGFLFVSIIVDMGLCVIFYMLSKSSYETYQIQKFKYMEFQSSLKSLNLTYWKTTTNNYNKSFTTSLIHFIKDTLFFKKTNLVRYDSYENLEAIKKSIAKLESFYYTKYVDLLITSGNFAVISLVTFLFIVLEIF